MRIKYYFLFYINGGITYRTINAQHSAERVVINNIEGTEMLRWQPPQWSSMQHIRLPHLAGGIYLARFVSGKVSGNVKFFVE